MGVYIKGMEMPKNCWECPFQEYGNCFANGDKPIDKSIDEDNRDKDCPLVPVPPHGRLIDADALISVLKVLLENPVGFNGARADTFAIRRTIELLEESQTIIPADKEG